VIQGSGNTFYEVGEFKNSLYGIGSYEITDKGCLTKTGVTSSFIATSFYAPFSGGNLKFQLKDGLTLAIYHFCLKVFDDSYDQYSTIIDNLSV
jgi:hypothetical protein